MLSVQKIFSSNDYLDEGFDRPRWCSNESYYTTLQTHLNLGKEIIYHNPNTNTSNILVNITQLYLPGVPKPLLIEDYILSNDLKKVLIFTNSIKVWRLNTKGSYWVLDLSNNKNNNNENNNNNNNTNNSNLYQLGKTLPNPKVLMFATFSPCNTKVAYVYEHNIYVEDLATHAITQLTFDGNQNIINGTFDWVYEEEFHMRNGFRWSPDGKNIAFWQLDQTNVPIVHLINNTDTKYPELIPIHYPKTGDQNSIVKIGIVSIEDNNDRNISWIPIPSDGEGYHSNSNNYLADMTYHHSSGEILIQQLNRVQNHLTIWKYNPINQSLQVIFEDHDDAWIDILHEHFWIHNLNSFLLISDRNGSKQICIVNADGNNNTNNSIFLTPPNVDVESIQGVDQSNGYIYYIASPNDPLRRYLYRVNIDGSNNIRITPNSDEFTGTNAYSISKDGKFAIHTFSTQTRPPSFNIIELSTHQVVNVLASNQALLSKFQSLNLPPPEFFNVDVGVDEKSGASGLLDGYCFYPPELWNTLSSNNQPAPHSYPVIFYVYGEPAAQVARDQWLGKMGLWHRYLTLCGAVVICVDNRGVPAPRGRAFRKSVYKQIGILSSSDQAHAVTQILSSRPYLDPNRVAVWGWSGGGSMSLNLLFRYPTIYKTAISVAPVPDMHYYDTIYQERYMGLPSENEENYVKGSPITFAHQMSDHQNLLLIHGTGDDNCHYATTEILINQLIRTNKSFDMFAYPNRSHSINEGENTTRHLFEKMTKFFEQNGLISRK